MTKSYKKEERLSPRVKDLITTAKIKYATKPEKAIKYLRSLNPNELNLYDRQKIGREILSRVNAEEEIAENTAREGYDMGDGEGSVFYEGMPHHLFVRKVMKDYQVEGYPRINDREKPIPAEYGLKGTTQSILFGAISRRKQGIQAGKGYLREAKECGNDVEERKARYLWAGDSFEEAGALDRAIPAFKTAFKYMNGKAKEYSTDEERTAIAERISKLEKLKTTRDTRKASILEGLARTSAIIGLVGGIFFLSTNITGNAIADLSTKTTSFLGAGLLIVGLVAGFFWVKSRKK
jgi:hypothetical protein